MRAKVYVTPKQGVLDPQGLTIQKALYTLGYDRVGSVRQGKYFEIQLQNQLTDEEARQLVDKIAHDVLTNPIIEDYRFEVER
ncbi:MAG: phosphoribosylformylglycinamidine synthase subunit PurS [Acidobacteria bacterium]|nr:phosphoribosylformylglycinamidine synthase subunit PurS [Acidobacteriota bacterium]